MSFVKRDPIEQLEGKTIATATFIDGGVWFDVEIVTTDGFVIVSGGYKGDAQASLSDVDGTVKEWDW